MADYTKRQLKALDRISKKIADAESHLTKIEDSEPDKRHRTAQHETIKDIKSILKHAKKVSLLVALFFYGLEWIYLHGSFGSDADGFHGFLIFLMMAIISSEGDHTDARLRLRVTDLYGFHGFSDCPLRTIVPSPD